MSPPSLQWLALSQFLNSLSPSSIWIVNNTAFLAFLSRLIPGEILHILLYPWTFANSFIEPDFLSNPFRHFDEDLIPLYFHSRSAIRRAFLNHRCSLFGNSILCPHFASFLGFERSINHDFYYLNPSFPNLDFFVIDPLLLFPPSPFTDPLNRISSHFQYYFINRNTINNPVYSSSSSLNVLSIDSLPDLYHHAFETISDSEDSGLDD